MRRRPARQSQPAKSNPCRSIILVDGTRVRRQVKKEYEKVLKDLERARQELARFHQEDVPCFSRWVSRKFGALLTELREASQRLQEHEQLLFEIENEMYFTNAAPGRAYERVMRRRQNSGAAPDPREHAQEDGSWDGQQRTDPYDPSDPQTEFEDFFGQTGRQHDRSRPRRRPMRGQAEARLKDLYRAVVRLLHPDAQRDMTEQKREWWHQAQQAYQEDDADQLEVILTLCEIEEDGSTDKASLSVLQRITAQFKKSLRHIKTELTQCRHDPAWNFSGRKDLEVTAAQMRRNLEHDLRMIKEELREMEEQVTFLAAQAKRSRRPSSRRRPRSEPFDCPF